MCMNMYVCICICVCVCVCVCVKSPPIYHHHVQEKRMVVFVEASVMEDSHVTTHAGFPLLKDKLMNFREGQDDLTDKIDFIICLGGDGTLLYASSLFQVIRESERVVRDRDSECVCVCSRDNCEIVR